MIESRQVARVELHRIFDEYQHLHFAFGGVVGHVVLVFDELDDRQHDARIPRPDHHAVNSVALFEDR